ncbi:hypothetical protein Ahy_A05g022404 [Arachis hypogaea]|uniref:SWIM-type domain-containing protein n=1 Tax=Arachis hypogaea TaxID=3818 RepID=A0A445D0G0_ARAHY|nr:hypothetical protein Ahy_A05g022402 [Arachis hypogaea]RYR56714.1 hypothetical protein Ahy_A05g022404 [Arachis hypogaea]
MCIANNMKQAAPGSESSTKRKCRRCASLIATNGLAVFLVEELEPFEVLSQRLFHIRLMAGTCDCGLFQSLHFPCHHALAACVATSIE